MKTMSAPVDAQEKGHQRLLARVEDEEVIEAMNMDEKRRVESLVGSRSLLLHLAHACAERAQWTLSGQGVGTHRRGGAGRFVM